MKSFSFKEYFYLVFQLLGILFSDLICLSAFLPLEPLGLEREKLTEEIKPKVKMPSY